MGLIIDFVAQGVDLEEKENHQLDFVGCGTPQHLFMLWFDEEDGEFYRSNECR